MADPPLHAGANSDTVDDTGVAPDREPPPGTPRWVKVLGIIALVVVLALVILMVAGGHDPSRFGH